LILLYDTELEGKEKKRGEKTYFLAIFELRYSASISQIPMIFHKVFFRVNEPIIIKIKEVEDHGTFYHRPL
jgi:hypothetical protein